MFTKKMKRPSALVSIIFAVAMVLPEAALARNLPVRPGTTLDGTQFLLCRELEIDRVPTQAWYWFGVPGNATKTGPNFKNNGNSNETRDCWVATDGLYPWIVFDECSDALELMNGLVDPRMNRWEILIMLMDGQFHPFQEACPPGVDP